MAEDEFDFEAEFSLLDIGATSSMLRTGSVRPTVLAFSARAGVEAIALDWNAEQDAGAAEVERAFEEARRYIRDLDPAAYALITRMSRENGIVRHHLPGAQVPTGSEHLGLAMFSESGCARAALYPVRRGPQGLSFGMPAITDAEILDWCPLGDIWRNPFCVGDTVKFRARERAVDPAGPLWQAVVELTRLRIHEDQAGADEYMAFLDDLRTGVFVVAGRSRDDAGRVLLRPRTIFNPVGTLNVEAGRVMLADTVAPEVEAVGDRTAAR